MGNGRRGEGRMTLDLGYAQLESISRAVEMQNMGGSRGE